MARSNTCNPLRDTTGRRLGVEPTIRGSTDVTRRGRAGHCWNWSGNLRMIPKLSRSAIMRMCRCAAS